MKNKKKQIITISVCTLVMIAAVWNMTGWNPFAPGNGVKAFMNADLANCDDKLMAEHIRKMKLANANDKERTAVLNKLYDATKKMSIQQQAALAQYGLQNLEGNSDLSANMKILMVQYMGREAREYIKKSPEERRATIEQFIAREKAIEAGQKAARLASQLIGKNAYNNGSDPSTQGARVMAKAAADAMKYGSAADRAAAGQMFSDLQAARSRVGLPARL